MPSDRGGQRPAPPASPRGVGAPGHQITDSRTPGEKRLAQQPRSDRCGQRLEEARARGRRRERAEQRRRPRYARSSQPSPEWTRGPSTERGRGACLLTVGVGRFQCLLFQVALDPSLAVLCVGHSLSQVPSHRGPGRGHGHLTGSQQLPRHQPWEVGGVPGPPCSLVVFPRDASVPVGYKSAFLRSQGLRDLSGGLLLPAPDSRWAPAPGPLRMPLLPPGQLHSGLAQIGPSPQRPS